MEKRKIDRSETNGKAKGDLQKNQAKKDGVRKKENKKWEVRNKEKEGYLGERNDRGKGRGRRGSR